MEKEISITKNENIEIFISLLPLIMTTIFFIVVFYFGIKLYKKVNKCFENNITFALPLEY